MLLFCAILACLAIDWLGNDGENVYIMFSKQSAEREKKVAGSGRQTDREKGKRANIYREFQTTAITTTSKNMGRKESLFAPAAMSK